MKSYLNNNFNLNDLVSVLDELPLWSAPFGLKLLEYVTYKPNITVLDIGFGMGFPLTELAMRLGNSSIVYGIDPWKEATVRARQKIELYKITNIKIIEGVAESIPLENYSVDLITSNNGINNVSDIDKVLSECSRIIKSGGQFVQTMNLDKNMIEFYDQLENVLSELNLNKEIEAMHQHIVHKRPPVDGYVAKLQKQGFIINEVVYDEFNYKFTDGTAMLNHYFIRVAFMESWINLLPPYKVEQIFHTIESKLNEQAKEFGEIKLSIPFVLINTIKK